MSTSLYCVVRIADQEVVGASAVDFASSLDDALIGNVHGMRLWLVQNRTSDTERNGLEANGYRLEKRACGAAVSDAQCDEVFRLCIAHSDSMPRGPISGIEYQKLLNKVHEAIRAALTPPASDPSSAGAGG